MARGGSVFGSWLEPQGRPYGPAQEWMFQYPSLPSGPSFPLSLKRNHPLLDAPHGQCPASHPSIPRWQGRQSAARIQPLTVVVVFPLSWEGAAQSPMGRSLNARCGVPHLTHPCELGRPQPRALLCPSPRMTSHEGLSVSAHTCPSSSRTEETITLIYCP